MKNPRKFFICRKCGNLVTLIEESGAKLVCCGSEMELLVANTTDGAHEKHLPVAQWNGNELTVHVGSVPHPMSEEHHIAWVAVAYGNKTQIVKLNNTDEPVAKFLLEKQDVTIYEFCNLHGLWATEV